MIFRREENGVLEIMLYDGSVTIKKNEDGGMSFSLNLSNVLPITLL